MKNLNGLLFSSLLIVGAAAQAQTFPEGMVPLRGEITAQTKDSVTVTTKEGATTVKLDKALKQYERKPSELSKISDKTFVGVTSVKTDGQEKATEVHIFPAELNGVAEGSYMMDEPKAAGKSENRMSNGAVKMDRMTNGSVLKNKDSNLTLTFKGGEQVIMIPKDVPVTMITAVPKTFKVGDKVFVLAQKGADGSLTTKQVIVAK